MAINWINHQKKNKGKWVAFKNNEKDVIATGKSAKEVLLKAEKKGYLKPILSYFPQKVITYVG